jgi:DNA-binding MarR family transcriptional regulator
MIPRLTDDVRTWLYLMRLMKKISARLDVHLEQYDLTPAQFDVLAQLRTSPGMLQQELADRLLVTKGNVVGLLNRMERADLVKRELHPDDGRAHLVSLTARGSALADQVVPEHEALIVEYFAVLDPADRITLHDLARKFKRKLASESLHN